MRYQRLPTQGPRLVQHETAMAFLVCPPRPNSMQCNTCYNVILLWSTCCLKCKFAALLSCSRIFCGSLLPLQAHP